ncbi:MAG TPA: hypothetical protein VN257_10690 [Actinotalea sp.]|nr:hypothetical protein [Actinotalea sp.]
MSDPSTSPAAGPVGRLASLTPGLRALLVLDVVLVLVLLVLLALHLVNSVAADAPPTSTAPVEDTPEVSAPEAPADAETLSVFRLPSGNIWCEMTETSATCTIVQFSFTPPEPPPDCTGTVGNLLSVTAGQEPTMPCVTQPVGGPPDGAVVLEYGQASTIGEMTCHSSTNGATCRHNPTGAGFSVARGGYTFL